MTDLALKHKTAVMMAIIAHTPVSKERAASLEKAITDCINDALHDGYVCGNDDEYRRGRREGMKEGMAVRARMEAAR